MSNLAAKYDRSVDRRDSVAVPGSIRGQHDRILDATRIAPRKSELSLRTVLLVLVAHVPLGVIVRAFPIVANAHALLALGLGFVWAAQPRRVDRVAYIGAYVAGAEVLWRVVGAQTFYEYGKYAIIAIFLVSLLKSGRLRMPTLPLLYFLLLLPSVGLTIAANSFEMSRDQISFNLSGPLAIAVCAWFFSHCEMTAEQRRRVFFFLIAPIVALSAILFVSTITAVDLTFSDNSNFATSGGFGPNQVSAVLGLGAFVALFLVMDTGLSWPIRLFMFALMLAFGAQSALTFSRGGLYAAGGAAALVIALMLREAHSRLGLAALAVLGFLVVNFFLWPYLNSFTGGALSERFTDTDPTMRDELVRRDLQIWGDNPLLGVGPGEARYYRTVTTWVPGSGKRAPVALRKEELIAAHTELSRMLAEHGLLGLVALTLLLVAAVRNTVRQPAVLPAACAAGLTCWSILCMMSNAMRLVAPAFAFALPFAILEIDAVIRAPRAIVTRRFVR